MVLRDGQVVGFVDAPTSRSTSQVKSIGDEAIWGFESIGGEADDEEEDAVDEEEDGTDAGGGSVEAGGADDKAAAAQFAAYPALSAPDRVAPGQKFDVVVGFRPTADEALTQTGSFHVPAPSDEAQCLVLLVVNGLTADRNAAPLPLKMHAQARFACVATGGVGKASITAQFVYGGQLVATAARDVAVVDPAAGGAAGPAVGEKPARWRMTAPAADPGGPYHHRRRRHGRPILIVDRLRPPTFHHRAHESGGPG